MGELDPSQTLWDFALAFYAQPHVADACLQLQDKHQANVCLLIGMCWLDARQQYLVDAEFAILKNRIEGWAQEVVMPLRSLRRLLKLPFENLAQDETQTQLRMSIKQAELLAEKKLLLEIERWTLPIAVSKGAINLKNLARYARELNAPQTLMAILQPDTNEDSAI